MGNSCSWFGPVRRCSSAAPQLACFLIDDADRHIEEAHLPMSVANFFDSDSFPGERAAKVDEVAAPFDLSVGANLAHRGFGRVIGLWKPPWHRPRRRLVDACRSTLAERLMRSLFVVVAPKRRKAASLSGAGCRRRPHRFQKREVEAPVPAVLLRMAGINPFMSNAKLDPPHRQRRQASGP